MVCKLYLNKVVKNKVIIPNLLYIVSFNLFFKSFVCVCMCVHKCASILKGRKINTMSPYVPVIQLQQLSTQSCFIYIPTHFSPLQLLYWMILKQILDIISFNPQIFQYSSLKEKDSLLTYHNTIIPTKNNNSISPRIQSVLKFPQLCHTLVYSSQNLNKFHTLNLVDMALKCL